MTRELATSETMHDKPRIGILTVSDRASRGEYEDRGGPAIRSYLEEVVAQPFDAVAEVVADDLDDIAAALERLCDQEDCWLVVTTGGTGPAPSDVTPEATLQILDKELPGFGELMRKVSLEKVATAILSRQTAGIRGRSMVVNLPGQPKAIAECLDAVFGAIPYGIELLGRPFLRTNTSRFEAFRPKSAPPLPPVPGASTGASGG